MDEIDPFDLVRGSLSDLGTYIRVRRARFRISQSELARAAGKDPGQISRLEAGIGNPELKTVQEVLRALRDLSHLPRVESHPD